MTSASQSPALPPTLQRVMRGHSCSGCGLCAGIDPAIAMKRDAKGWLRPEATGPTLPATEAAMQLACPGARVSPWEPPTGGGGIDPLWGPYLRILAGYSTDEEVRHIGSSGGALSALAIHLLQTGRVNRVLHVGMDPDAPLLTQIVRSFGRADVLKAAGSRYAPVSPLAELAQELETPGDILFIAKPCDVGALRAYMSVNPAVAARFPYLLSFFCAGTPSQNGTDRIIRHLGAEPENVRSFRYRGSGWPGYATADLADGTSKRMGYGASWGDILSREVQFRCKICPDAVGGAADVAAADAWYGGESGYPAFDEADGRSLILTRTPIGDALVRDAEAAGALVTEPLAIGEIIKMQPGQSGRKRLVASRMAAMAVMMNPMPGVKGLMVGEAMRQASLFANLKSMAGTIRRIAIGRR